MIKYLRKLKHVMKSNESLFLPNCLDAKCTVYIIHTYILLFSQNKKRGHNANHPTTINRTCITGQYFSKLSIEQYTKKISRLQLIGINAAKSQNF